jgi:hypothetical protein
MSKDILTTAKPDRVADQIAVRNGNQRSGPSLIEHPNLRSLRDSRAQRPHALRKVVCLQTSRFRLTDQAPELPKGLGDRLEAGWFGNPNWCDPSNRFPLFRAQAGPPNQNEVRRSPPERLEVRAWPRRDARQLTRRNREITGWVYRNHPRTGPCSKQQLGGMRRQGNNPLWPCSESQRLPVVIDWG